MEDYRGLVEEALQAVTVHSPTAYSWFGHRSPDLTRVLRKALAATDMREYLVDLLQSQLYRNFYCRGRAHPNDEGYGTPPPTGVTPFITALSEANVGQGYWESGWNVEGDHGEYMIIRRGHLRLRAEPHEVGVATDTAAHSKSILLRRSKEMPQASPGFYMALGDVPLPVGEPLIRFYLHITPSGAVRLMKEATAALNETGLPFRLKVLNDPESFRRCDAGVLYLPRSQFAASARVIEAVIGALYSALRPETPVFTKRLAPGVGLAEDPSTDESFGMHRCRLVADGMIRAWERRCTSLPDRLAEVEAAFSEQDLKLDAPYLNPGRADCYSWKLAEPVPVEVLPIESTEADVVGTDLYLETALAIGRRLTTEALWHEQYCSWLGAEPESVLKPRSTMGTSFRTLSPDLYGGTAGVALVLAHLHGVSGDNALRRTAIGAIRHALWRVRNMPQWCPVGLYAGRVGVALAAVRVGLLLGHESLLEDARRLLIGDTNTDEFDLISGRAGGIIGLLRLAELLHDPTLLDLAAQLGDHLIRCAQVDSSGWSWTSLGATQPNLVGLSHGSAGVALALSELYQQTDAIRYRDGARMALAYEAAWYDPQQMNWPDLRRPSNRQGPPSYPIHWCHGAPGIALCRWRVWEILGDEECKEQALIALTTTRKAVESAIRSGTENYSLCHGLMGNAEVLLDASRGLGMDFTQAQALAHQVAQLGIAQHARTGLAWPCGTGGGETPGLFLGLTGIALFYLRLCAPAVPSVLILPSCA